VRLRALALDYDGTLAEDGVLHPHARAAIEEARRRGLVVVLVTGRILADLRQHLGDLELFDAVVAENGAVVAYPHAERTSHSSAHCPAGLVELLRARGVETRVGECVVETAASACQAVLQAVRELELPLALHFNRGRLMVLPLAISKATGLQLALRTMRLSPHNAIGVGDAENDHELLAVCEIGAAVAWGSRALQEAADCVIEGRGPEAVAEYVRSVTRLPGIHLPPRARRRLLLGSDAGGAEVTLPERGRNVLVAGDPQSGKSWITGLLCEQLVLQGYCVCLLDPEGDYSALEGLPGVLLLGGAEPVPSMEGLVRTLRHADVSVVVDLARLGTQEKKRYVLAALRTLAELRRETGLPHRIVVDEAHQFLHDPEQVRVLDHELAGYTLVTYRISDLHADVLAATDSALITRETNAEEARLLHARWNGLGDVSRWSDELGSLAIDEAVLLPGREEGPRELRRFRVASRLTAHVRHRRKYLDVPLETGQAFRFVLDDGSQGPRAHSLRDLARLLAGIPSERLRGHLGRNDFSRWIGDVFRDELLAARIRELEQLHARSGEEFGRAAIRAIEERYQPPARVA
jgi:hydroxymethylpyrimidine pyrophosphatase-like HAD family hydrolase